MGLHIYNVILLFREKRKFTCRYANFSLIILLFLFHLHVMDYQILTVLESRDAWHTPPKPEHPFSCTHALTNMLRIWSVLELLVFPMENCVNLNLHSFYYLSLEKQTFFSCNGLPVRCQWKTFNLHDPIPSNVRLMFLSGIKFLEVSNISPRCLNIGRSVICASLTNTRPLLKIEMHNNQEIRFDEIGPFCLLVL
jgi:hypothetical protein